MKKLLVLILATVMAVTAFGLTACGGNNDKKGGTKGEGSLYVYDLSNPADVEITIDGKPDSIYEVRFGSSLINKDHYSYSGGKLTISKDKLGTSSASPNKQIKVILEKDGEPIVYRLIIATKVITTCTAFQGISENLKGTYVLGADLDFEDFGNFNPIGNDAQKRGDKIGLAFTGSLIGAGHTISNLTADADDMADDEVYTEHNVYVDAENNYPTVRSCFGIFMLNSGTIEDICFKDCTVKNSAGTIMGLVVAVNEGLIKNVFVDGGKVDGGNIWLDYNCFNAGFAGINGRDGKIENCVSTVTEIKGGEGLVRAFCGKTWGEIKNCYACKEDDMKLKELATGSINDRGIIGSDNKEELSDATGYGFTYLATESGITKGSFDGCLATDAESLKQASLYTKYDNNIWEISEGTLPALKVLYSKSK